MTRWIQSISKFSMNEHMYLYVLMMVCILTPCAYLAYLSMSAAMLETSIMDLLSNSSVESIHLITNISAIYSAYSIYQHVKQPTKMSYLSLILLVIAQGFLMNWFTLVMLLYYMFHYIGYRNWKMTFQNASAKQGWKALFPALLVLCVSILTFIMKIKLGLLF